MEDFFEKIVIGVGVVTLSFLLIAGLGLIMAFPVKWCWNATMPEIFGLIKITWVQAWCLIFLAGSLIKSTQTNNNN